MKLNDAPMVQHVFDRALFGFGPAGGPKHISDCPACLVEEAERLGSPREGEFAERLWRWSNYTTTPVKLAVAVMTEAGYVPFAGFPLRRAK